MGSPCPEPDGFPEGRISSRLNSNSYKMGATAADMNDILPDFVSEALTCAFNMWKADYPLFVSSHAILLGAETRTSSPVRITRKATYESVNVRGLYPIGEGSGYAGGITSSATDALKAVEAGLSADSGIPPPAPILYLDRNKNNYYIDNRPAI